MDVLDFGRYFASLLLVGGLLGFAWLAARRFGANGGSINGIAGIFQNTTRKRLSVVESMMLGPKHKLFLLRRDGIEHLVVVGPEGASVVENGIPAQQPVAEQDVAHAMTAEHAV